MTTVRTLVRPILGILVLLLLATIVGCGSGRAQVGCGGGSGFPCHMPTPTPTPAPVTSIPFNPFTIGNAWDMLNPDGGITHFEVRTIDHFGCETGELVNLRITKTQESDYWNIANEFLVQENFILKHDANGDWRSIGDYTESDHPEVVLTRNWLTPPGAVYKPYIVLPGDTANIRMDTGYLYAVTAGTTFECLPPPTDGYIASWTSEFTWTDGVLHAHYIEDAIHNDKSEETWGFAAGGMTYLTQTYQSQVPRTPPYTLTRIY